ncbi:hypothetical protein BCR22_05115 [Enterococcus plantarum]|uniref:hypothetical protein n=1 Tax=Enterococcus plantarum TaxID=1077675 RepID=UPI00084DFC7B|nr:hypothetical protein [Enterococcus plantarum]MBO0423247.1 hypothetical protein [Enterococcus plantarum]OEG11108.1 hypothetical protein BCR22_05115 [Enterococcus plantarum]
MEELAKKLLKELKKNLEKIRVQAIGSAKIQKSHNMKQESKKQGETAIESAKKALSSSSQIVEGAVKGQFGKKVTEAFEKQQQTLDKLSS